MLVVFVDTVCCYGTTQSGSCVYPSSDIVTEVILRRYLADSPAIRKFFTARQRAKEQPSSKKYLTAYKRSKEVVRPEILKAKATVLQKIRNEEKANMMTHGFICSMESDSPQLANLTKDLKSIEHYLHHS